MALDFPGRVQGGKVVPLHPSDAEALSNMEGGEVRCVLTQRKARSNPQLRLWWGFCGLIAENLPHKEELDSKQVSDLLKIENGHCYVFKDAEGRYRQVPRSIALQALDQDRFNALMDGAVEAAGRLFSEKLSRAAWKEVCEMMEREP